MFTPFRAFLLSSKRNQICRSKSGYGKAVRSLSTSTSPGYSDILHGNSLPRVGSNLPLLRTSSFTIILYVVINCKSIAKISCVNFYENFCVCFCASCTTVIRNACSAQLLYIYFCRAAPLFTFCTQLGGTIEISHVIQRYKHPLYKYKRKKAL